MYSHQYLPASKAEHRGVHQPSPVVTPNYLSKSKPTSFYIVLSATLAVLFFGSCKKAPVSLPNKSIKAYSGDSITTADNTPPKVNAGLNRRVITPASKTTLSGSGSDKEGPVSFQWKQAKGPNTATIAKPNQSVTEVSNLKLGVYRFVLTATDNSNTSRTDTTVVSVMEKLTWTVSGLSRQAVVHVPNGSSTTPPVVFAFHGHGGTDTGFADKAFEDYWEEAVVVYPLGLRSKGEGDPHCRKSGWQKTIGEVNCITGVIDQDIKFFDAMLPTLQNKYNANLNLVFANGHSNGGDFLYDALWPTRGNKLAALAPSASYLDSPPGTSNKSPKPLIHAAGTQDNLVLFSDQEQGVKQVRVLNQCSTTGVTWATGPDGLLATRYASPIHAPVVFIKYNGQHNYPTTVPPLIIRFFKEVANDLSGNGAEMVKTRL